MDYGLIEFQGAKLAKKAERTAAMAANYTVRAIRFSAAMRRMLRMAYLIRPNAVLMLTPVLSAISLNDIFR